MISVLSAGGGNQEGVSPSWTFPRRTRDESPRSAACRYRGACYPARRRWGGRGKVVSFCGKGMPSSAGGGGGGMGARPINGYIWLFSFHYLPFLAGKAKKRRPLKWALEKLDTSGQGKRAPSEKSGPRASGDGLPAAATPIIRGADPAVFCRKPCNAGKEIFRPSILWKSA